ncbi:MAG: circularly permuted type 2 ATP-grasp protein, partial [Reyranellaceae bacterium]
MRLQQQNQNGGNRVAAFDEMRLPDNAVRDAYRDLTAWLQYTPNEIFLRKRQEADALFRRLGITFAVYSEGGDRERLIPFDIIPRVLAAKEWESLSKGLVQRVKALNAFLHDIYHEQEILKAGRVPSEMV